MQKVAAFFSSSKDEVCDEGVKILPDDVFIVSYPKSGNTWVRFLVGNYITGGGIDFLNSHFTVPDIHYNPEQCEKILSRPRFIKSHKAYTPVYPKVVYIYRDGRDVIVSYYFWMKKMGIIGDNVSFSDFLHQPLGQYENWSKHIESWMGRRNVISVRYEDLLIDALPELGKMIRFAGMEVDEERLKVAVEASDFSRMQKMEKDQNEGFFIPSGSRRDDILFVRRGQSGDWKNHFKKEDEEYFLKLHGKVMKRLGYI